MNGWRFYLEHETAQDKRKGKHTGNVVAIPVTEHGTPDRNHCFWNDQTYFIECVAAVLFHADSPACGCSVSVDWLRDVCKRISEQQAREIHPELFKRLEATS